MAKKGPRIYTRNQGGAVRFYGDFRPLGGGREGLTPKGEKRATTDPDVAAKLYADRVAELERKSRLKHLHGIEAQQSLKPYASYHLRQKARDGEVTERWLEEMERHFGAAVSFFGAETDLRAISPRDCTRWTEHLRRRGNRRGGTLQDGSVRKYLNSLSNLYGRAVSEGLAERNPVGDMYSKPTEVRREANFLEAHEATLFLESARTFVPRTEDGAFPWLYPLFATFLLTGGRKSEVLGLEIDDVSFSHSKIYFRPNEWRTLKTRGSKRSVRLWPQLETILREYLLMRERSGGIEGTLLFPKLRKDRPERMLNDLRKALDRVAERASFQLGQVRLHGLRHTYTAARIQTLDRGQPVALYTVARELGHASTTMIEDRYGHLHDRAANGSEVVEFKVERHRDKLADRLAALAKVEAAEAKEREAKEAKAREAKR